MVNAKGFEEGHAEGKQQGFSAGFHMGKIDGAKSCADSLVNAAGHPYDCDCEGCQLLDWIHGGSKPAWA